jgi:hypothetical protein
MDKRTKRKDENKARTKKIPLEARDFFFFETPGPASYLESAGFFPGVKGTGREAHHSPPPSDEITNDWSCTSHSFIRSFIYKQLNSPRWALASLAVFRHSSLSWVLQFLTPALARSCHLVQPPESGASDFPVVSWWSYTSVPPILLYGVDRGYIY